MRSVVTYIVNCFNNLSRANVDAIVISCISIALWLLAVEHDLFEEMIEFLESHEDWELDELIVAVTFAGLGGFVFGLRRILERDRELKLRKKAEVRANWLAQHDPLTHLPNRRFLKTLARTLEKQNPETHNLALLAVDLDGFKKVNDLLGHDAGDELLKVIASRLKETFPDSTVLRLGGDEFLVVTSAKDVSVAAGWDTVNNLIRKLNAPVELFGVSAEVGASVGIAIRIEPSETLETLASSADAALYHAKGSGRNSAAFYEPFMSEALKDRAKSQARVRNAIKNGELIPYFQPILDMATQKVVGAETLARWPDTESESISPRDIINIAEDLGAVIQLSEYLLEKSVEAAVDWPEQPALFLNLAPTMLADKLLAQRVEGIAKDAGFPPERLTIEFPEVALHKHKESAKEIIGHLKDLGVRIALDEFGSGHSNLAELAELPFDLVKLDRSLLAASMSGETERAVIETYVRFARSLAWPLVAVGVESKAQQAFLQELKCEFVQGFLYAPALPNAEFVPLLSDRGKTSAA